MNEQANKVLADLLQKASNGIDAAVSFSQAQMPDVVHQLLIWNFTRSLIMTIAALISIPIVFYLIRQQFRRIPHKTCLRAYVPTMIWDQHGDISPLVMILIFALVLWTCWDLMEISDLTWLKIWIAPKLYLLEYAASLIK